jgi:hypothetical protein
MANDMGKANSSGTMAKLSKVNGKWAPKMAMVYGKPPKATTTKDNG